MSTNKLIMPIAPQMEQDFAVVDSIINAHTNTAVAKVNAVALQTYWEVGQFVSERLQSAAWGEHAVDELGTMAMATPILLARNTFLDVLEMAESKKYETR